MSNIFKNIGPGAMITAAFIGPGTITVCLIAGNAYGLQLLWALLFAAVATIVLQSMSAKLGLVTGNGLGEAIRNNIQIPWVKYASFGLISMGILLGNAAYEAGNISGSLIGMQLMTPTGLDVDKWVYTTIVYGVVFVLLYQGSFLVLEKFFISVVILMSISFVVAAILSTPNVVDIMSGLFQPTVPQGSIMTVVALVGTTVVPYNLFLHASMVHKKWQGTQHLPAVRIDTIISIFVGGLVSICIVISGASVIGIEIKQMGELAIAFEQIFGVYGRYICGFGIFAAGITSTITAPLAAAYVAKGIWGWDDDMRSIRFRLVWIVVLTIGFIFATLGYKPIEIIRIAQFSNGLLLPFIAIFLIWIVNQKQIMGNFSNTKWQNIMAILVTMVSILLGAKGIYTLF